MSDPESDAAPATPPDAAAGDAGNAEPATEAAEPGLATAPPTATAMAAATAPSAEMATAGLATPKARAVDLTSLAIDLAVGFCAVFPLAVLFVFALVFRPQAFVPVAAGLFFVAAMVRAIWSRKNPWLEGLAIGLGACVLVALIALAAGARPLAVAEVFLFVALLCGAGAQTTQLLKTRRGFPAAVSLALTAVLVFLAGKHLPIPSMPSFGMQTVDKPAPSLTLSMLDGAPVSLGSLKGHVVVLDFWGTWCGPCMAEMPTVLKVHRRYQANNDVAFFAVNTGWHDDDADRIRDTVARRHMDIPIAFDASAAQLFDVHALPTLIVIDRRGHIRIVNTGYSPSEDLEGELSGQIDEFLKASGR